MFTLEHNKDKIKTEGIYFTNCRKFNVTTRGNPDLNRAIVFLKLLQSGCARKPSLLFSGKPQCKIDTTKQMDGPRKFNVLKLMPEKMTTINGWQISSPKYEMGKEFIQDVKDITSNEDKDNFKEKKVENVVDQFIKKIERLHEDFRQLNGKYNLDELNDHELLSKVKQLRKDFNKSTQQLRRYVLFSYNNFFVFIVIIILDDIKFYNIGEWLHQQRVNTSKSNILNQFNIFPLFESDNSDNNQEIYTEQYENMFSFDNGDSQNKFQYKKEIQHYLQEFNMKCQYKFDCFIDKYFYYNLRNQKNIGYIQ